MTWNIPTSGAPPANKYADEVGKTKTSELIAYLTVPTAIVQRFPQPALAFGKAHDDWMANAKDFLDAVGEELDLRIPVRVKSQ